MDLRVLIAEEDAELKTYHGQDKPETDYEFVYAVGFAEAVQLASDRDARFGFLVTDVLLNPFHGRDLANRIVGSFPHIKVLFMGNQSHRVLRSAGLLPPTAPFLHKPFNALQLVKCLDELRENALSWLDLILFHSESLDQAPL
jgi:DNA-binding response OmpR family regulator